VHEIVTKFWVSVTKCESYWYLGGFLRSPVVLLFFLDMINSIIIFIKVDSAGSALMAP
jgi:hypothetical protein